MNAKKIFRAVLALLALALVAGCLYLNSLMPIITGYAAKNLASALFVSGRQQADVEPLDLNFSFIKFVRNKVDYDAKTVTSRFLWAKATAAYREGYGVTLLRGKGRREFLAQEYPLPPTVDVPDYLHPGEASMTSRLEPIARALVDERSYNGHPFAFVVLHRGGIVAERYDTGITASTRLLSWSMAKSFLHALVGIMVRDSLVDVYAPMDIPQWQADGRKAISLNDLMQMQSGLEWNENYGNRSDVNLMLHRERDMGLFALSKPLEYEPGTHYYYSSGNTNIAMRYLRGKFASDADFLGYIRSRLFAPLAIDGACFEPDMSGTPVASSYLYVTARDFARFGQMYLSDGMANQQRVLPEGWAAYAATPALGSEGLYGSGFWLNHSQRFPDVPRDMYACQGHDGQQVFIIPSCDLVVVILGYSPKPDRVIDFNRLLKDIIAVAE